MKKPPERMENANWFVHALFCDDIRQEMGNKVSFMGCYQGELLVPFVPLMLPKLCVQVTISSTVAQPLKALTVRLDQDTNQLALIEVPAGDLARLMSPTPENKARQSASVGVMLSPFTITEPGELRVVVVTEEGEIPGPQLRIMVMPNVEAVAAGEAVPKKPAAQRASAKKAK